ncbi:MAG: type I restriction endonuclease subunit R, partial [Chloroflexi bacterium]|nr:type I restriction endonuclease subunit R [Chloroflexota bacterium]
FSITRQIYYSTGTDRPSVDMVIFLNGLPIISIELKNEWTGQTVRDAEKQYMRRDQNEPLLQFGRCLVHFAVDSNDVLMCTRLAGRNSFFLPFNKGYRHGKGNPPNENGRPTAYLWEDILRRDSLATIIEHFVVLMGESRRAKLKDKTLFFPRYHQLDVVRQLLADLRDNGTGKRYLIQHSAGSGKSHSITWLAYQLIELYQPNTDAPLFDSVIVVTDRRVLDRQLSDNIGQFSEVKNIVAHADSAADLQKHLESGKKIIISTIQKFPYIVDGIDDLSDNRFAVIIDEAHSSQSGKSAMKLNIALGQDVDEMPDDIQEYILQTMANRKMRGNAAYFAFTATPKNATLEKFGVPDGDGNNFNPFHLYSMKQAIEEGFILDVLSNYTTYKSYYEIEKSIADNPLFDTVKAQKRLRKYVEGDPDTIAVKAEVMVEHFLEKVIAPKKLKGQAKGMVLTHDIKNAIRYYSAIKAALKKKNSAVGVLIAFSGKKQMEDGIEHSEESLNGFASKDIKDNFDGGDYQLLVVANKFLTGFDQPKLTTMYVDKKLQGVFAVQALSRLNRSNLKLGKRTEDLFILDFYNSISIIKAAFDDFYTATSLTEPTNVNVLHDLKHALDKEGVYEWHEVEQFNDLYFRNADAEQLNSLIQTPAGRFNHQLQLEEDEKVDFKIKAKQFVKIYGQMASILPFELLEWEMLFWLLKYLIPMLQISDKDLDAVDELLNSVDLSTYSLERKKLNEKIELDAADSEVEPQNPNMRGVHDSEEQRDPLDEIIAAFNERYGMSKEDFETKVAKSVDLAKDIPDTQSMVLDNIDEQNKAIMWEKMMTEVMLQQRRHDLSLYQLYASDDSFQRAYNTAVLKMLEEGNDGGEEVV